MTEVNLPDDIGAASRWRTRIGLARPAWRPRIDQLASAPLRHAAVVALLDGERGSGWRDESHLRAGLRHVRGLLLAALIDRDLDGRADLAEVMQSMTTFAALSIDEALAFHSWALAAVHGVPLGRTDGAPQDLLVVGMGKLGGGELNVSSDIDLIFVYPEAGETSAHVALVTSRARTANAPALRPIDNAEFFARLGRKLIATLADVTADGFVFRVDMRLRPDGDSGPLVTSFAMLETYLVRSARDWERFAWIKGRVVSRPVFGDAGAEVDLMALVTPFVYRRYLDFGAIDALRTLHGQIAAEAARRESARRGRGGGADRGESGASTRIDVKLGRGGIREIEFIAQHFQLIRGGRDPALRLRPTVATLDQLVAEELLDRSTGQALREAYAFLRNVEHRLQYLDDAQTHTLPARDQVDDCARVAAMCERLIDSGRTGFDGLVEALERHRAYVSAQFDAVFAADAVEDDAATVIDAATTATLWTGVARNAQAGDPGDATLDAAAATRLEAIGFVPPDAALARIVALARGSRLRSTSSASRARLDTLVPQVIDASGRQTEPTATLGRWFDLIETIAGRSAYLALLDEFPAALDAVTRLLAASPWAAQYLTRHPLLLDDLIATPQNDRGVRDAAAWSEHWDDTARALDRQLALVASDGERQMDVLREVHHAETFRLLIEDLEGHLALEMLSDQLSKLADLTLDAAIAHCWSHFVASRRDDPSVPRRPVFAVIAYGKLGGKELGYMSDLDLVFLFEHRTGASAGASEAASDDMQADADPAAVVQHYVRFAQRLNLWLTARTPAGALFDIDLRLRPDGAAGLVVSSFEGWSRYERRASGGLREVGAWTWEHQALTRARFSAGDRALGAAFEAERMAILAAREPDEAGRADLRREIVSMRKRMHDGHPNRSAAFDLKHDDGGMVDIEFAVQYLVLAYGATCRPLLDNVGNIALLSRAADAALIDPDDAREAADAYRTYRARQHAVRLADPMAHAARVDATLYARERASVRRLWLRLFEAA